MSDASETKTKSFFLGFAIVCLIEVVGVLGLGDCCDITIVFWWWAYDVLGDTAGETLEVGLTSPPLLTAVPAVVPQAGVLTKSGEVSQHHEARIPPDMRA